MAFVLHHHKAADVCKESEFPPQWLQNMYSHEIIFLKSFRQANPDSCEWLLHTTKGISTKRKAAGLHWTEGFRKLSKHLVSLLIPV